MGKKDELFVENLEDISDQEELVQVSDEEDEMPEGTIDFEDLMDDGEEEEKKPTDINEIIRQLQEENFQLKNNIQEKEKQYKGLQQQTTKKLQDYSGLRLKHEDLSNEVQELRERIKTFEANIPGGGYMSPEQQTRLKIELEDRGMSPEVAELKAQMAAMEHNNKVEKYENEYKNLRAQEASLINQEVLRNLKEDPVYGQEDILRRGQEMFQTYAYNPQSLNLQKLFAMAALAEKYAPSIAQSLKEEEVEEYTRSGGYERPRPKTRPLPVPSVKSSRPVMGTGSKVQRVRIGEQSLNAQVLDIEDLADEILGGRRR